MKKVVSVSFQILFLGIIISVSSCKKDAANETFSYTEPIHQACANDYIWLSGQESSFPNDITTATVQQAYASQGRTYDASKLVSAKLISLKATAATGTANLDDIASIRVYVKLSGATSDVEIAHAESISSGATSVSLTIDAVELKAFITQLSVLTVKITTKGGVNSENCIDFSQGVIQVEVKP